MTIRFRATWGAIALCTGLLMVVGGSVSKSTEVIKYNRDLERGKANLEPPNPTGENIVMALGWVLSAAGSALVVWALRDMTRQIGEIQAGAEARMRMEAAQKQVKKE